MKALHDEPDYPIVYCHTKSRNGGPRHESIGGRQVGHVTDKRRNELALMNLVEVVERLAAMCGNNIEVE
jgi:hypothetical protein